MRSRFFGIGLAVLIAAGTTGSAQEIFSDGFEWGSTCAWSNDLWYPDADYDLFGDDQASGVPSDCPPPFGMVDNNLDCDDGEEFVYPGAFEICDAQDNNCDDQVDEGFGTGEQCDGVGECGLGVVECDAGGGSLCSTEPGGSSDQSSGEVCDGLDNDCDGLEDDLGPLACYTGPISTLDVGVCSSGTQNCEGGVWGPCVGEVLPTTENCWDGDDNDCDASTDCDDTDCLGLLPPCLFSGQPCTASVDCLSNHCQNTFCCASGDCCSQPSDCPAAYSLAPTCTSGSTCQGHRVDAVCTTNICGSSGPIDDDSGCGPGTLAEDCSLYPDLYCDGSVVQTPPTCSSSCAEDNDCDFIAHCDDTTCEADLPDGSACDEATDCLSSHCDNDVCCASGICCADSGDCPGGMGCVSFTCV